MEGFSIRILEADTIKMQKEYRNGFTKLAYPDYQLLTQRQLTV